MSGALDGVLLHSGCEKRLELQFNCARGPVDHAIAIVMRHGTGLAITGAEMAKTKKRIVRREWTKDDIRQMKAMAKARAGVIKIAKSLKRTPGATQVKAGKLGVSLSTRL